MSLWNSIASFFGWHPSLPQQMKRDFVLSLGKHELQPNEQRDVIVIHSEDFHPIRLLIPRDVAKNFQICDIVVDGHQPVTFKIPAMGIPAVMFVENMVSDMEFSILPAGKEMIVKVLNTSPDRQVFIGSIVGYSYWVNENPSSKRSRLWPTI